MTFALKPNPILAEQQGFDAATEVEQASASLVSSPPGRRHRGHLVRDRVAADPASRWRDRARVVWAYRRFRPAAGRLVAGNLRADRDA